MAPPKQNTKSVKTKDGKIGGGQLLKFDTQDIQDIPGHKRVYMWGNALSMPLKIPPKKHCKLPVRVPELEKAGSISIML